MRLRLVLVSMALGVPLVAIPAQASGADVVLVESAGVVQLGQAKIVECPATFEFPAEALSGSWVTQGLSNYRCEFHADVAIRQIEVIAQPDRVNAKFIIEQDEGTDKEIDLEVSVVDADGNVLAHERAQMELDEGEITKDHIRVRLPKTAVGREIQLRLIIHGIGWG